MNAPSHPVIRIQPSPIAPSTSGAATSTPCGHCLHSSAGPVCRVEALATCPDPMLRGDPHQLKTLLSALDSELELVRQADGQPLPFSRSGLLNALELAEGEANLVLAVAPHCGGAQLAESAFQTLRRLLPDTDIYVTHA